MSINKEVRIDITPLFYPEIMTAPGQTPLNIKQINERYNEVINKSLQFKDISFNEIAIISINNVFNDFYVVLCSCSLDEVTLTSLSVEVAKTFYKEYNTNEFGFSINLEDLLIEEYCIEIHKSVNNDED